MKYSPIVTATLQATALASLSNLFAQLISLYHKDLPLDPFHISLQELGRFLLLTLITAPLNYHWQAFIERTFPARTPRVDDGLSDEDLEIAEKGLLDVKRPPIKSPMTPTNGTPKLLTKLSWRNTFVKWFVDCITLGALMNTTAFLILMGFMKGKTFPEIAMSVRRETIPIILASYKLWPFASVINFTLIPVERRIVFLSAVGLCWGVYLSMIAETV